MASRLVRQRSGLRVKGWRRVSESQQSATLTAEQREEIKRLIAERQAERRRLEQRPLPGWLPVAMRVLPHVLAIVTVLNLFIGLLAVVTPYLGLWFGPAVTDPIYAAYSLICPQRHSHTFHIEGHAMAFEQRDVAVHLGLGLAGVLYPLWSRMRRPLATWVALAMIAPMLIDVALSTAGILPSTWFSRLWTGSLAALAVVWWSYPRFENYLQRVKAHVAHLQESHSAQSA